MIDERQNTSDDKPRERESHDEPIVVDNRPLRIDLGQHATHAGNKWRRDFMLFYRLAVLAVDSTTMEHDATVFRLDPFQPVILHVTDTAGHGPDDDITLEIDKGGQLAMGARRNALKKDQHHPKYPDRLIVDLGGSAYEIHAITITKHGEKPSTVQRFPLSAGRKLYLFVISSPE